MGSSVAAGYAEGVTSGLWDLDRALLAHLTGNHYPPLPASLVPCAKKAIEACDSGAWDTLIELPEGITWRGQTSAPASACVEGWHLQAFLSEE